MHRDEKRIVCTIDTIYDKKLSFSERAEEC